MKRYFGGKFVQALVVGAILAGSGGATMAQSQLAQSGGALTVDEIRGCLCMDLELAAKREEIATRRAMLEERNTQLSLLSAQIVERRRSLDPLDTVGQALLKNLIAQETGLRDLIQSDTRPALNQSVAEYNALAALYTTECTTRQRYTFDVEQAKKDLVCPLP
ncbi:MAG: hypothetical protein JNL25_10220 [Rhodospirillaceae bacterium]|nr:hypothetical protein [Rhodospirillaceae bacterium]